MLAYLKRHRAVCRTILVEGTCGHLPKLCPAGYRNADSAGGKRVIVSAPDAAAVITELFGRFATGR